MDVRVGEPTRVDLTLETGAMSETVQVTAETPLLNTTTGISGTTVDASRSRSCRSATARPTC